MNMKYTMQTIAFVLTVSCLSSLGMSSNVRHKADDIQPTLDRLANMPFAEQQAWLSELEQRAGKAARIALSPDEAKQAQDEITGLLHRETITWAVLREAIVKTESLERRAGISLPKRQWKPVDMRPMEPTEAPPLPNPTEVSKPRPPKPVPAPIKQPLPELATEPTPSPLNKGATAGLPSSANETTPENTAGQASSGTLNPEISPSQQADKLEPPSELARPTPIEPKPEDVDEPKEAQAPKHGRFDIPMETQVEPPTRANPSARAVAPRNLPPGAVKINADELGARIAGCNMAFRALESELDEEGPWNAKSIVPLLDRLEILSIRRDDLNLYRDLLPEGKRANIAKLETTKSAISRLGSRIYEARRAVESEGYKGTDAERRAELGVLEMLSRRLAKAAGGEKKEEQK